VSVLDCADERRGRSNCFVVRFWERIRQPGSDGGGGACGLDQVSLEET